MHDPTEDAGPKHRFRMREPYRMIVNDDSGRGIGDRVAPVTAEQFLNSLFGIQIEGKPVDALFWCGLRNPCGTTRYNTRIGELFCSRQTEDMTAHEWTMRTTLLGLISQGHDPLTLICDRCHELGVDAWLSMRFNDVHHCRTPAHEQGAQLSSIYVERPHLRMGVGHGWKREFASRMWNYLNPEVRDHVYALLREAYLEYDVDGVELDFLRHPYLVPKAKLDEGRDVLNGFVKRLRSLADEAAEKKARPQGLAARVSSYDAACAEVGLDWRTWVREGWVDVLTASCLMPAEHEADMTPFVAECMNTGTRVYWCVESTPGFLALGPNMSLAYGDGANGLTTEHYRAMALAAYEQGVDGLYFFNLQFAYAGTAVRSLQAQRGMHPDAAFLNELHDPELIRRRDQKYLVSPSENGTDSSYFDSIPPCPLPRTLSAQEPECSFEMTLGSDLKRAAADDRLLSACLRICLRGMTPLDRITVLCDGVSVDGDFCPPLQPGTLIVGHHSVWIAELACTNILPGRGKHTCTVRLERRNPAVAEPVAVDVVELYVRFRQEADALPE